MAPLPRVTKRSDYRDLTADDLVTALFFDRLNPALDALEAATALDLSPAAPVQPLPATKTTTEAQPKNTP